VTNGLAYSYLVIQILVLHAIVKYILSLAAYSNRQILYAIQL